MNVVSTKVHALSLRFSRLHYCTSGKVDDMERSIPSGADIKLTRCQSAYYELVSPSCHRCKIEPLRLSSVHLLLCCKCVVIPSYRLPLSGQRDLLHGADIKVVPCQPAYGAFAPLVLFIGDTTKMKDERLEIYIISSLNYNIGNRHKRHKF